MPAPATNPATSAARDTAIAAAAAPPAAAGASAATTLALGGAIIAGGMATLLAALVAFLAALRAMHRKWLTAELGKYGHKDDVAVVIASELRREQAFADASVERVRAGLADALKIEDPEARRSAVEALFAAEERYAQQRSEAMAARAIAAVTRMQLRRDSPLGAFWKLGLANEHTAGCRFMAGHFWPWAVLDRVYPPRHYGCTSSLHSFGEAIHAGWMTPADVLEPSVAVRLAAGVAMDAGMAESVLTELALRSMLVEAGADTDALAAIEFKGVC